MVKKILKKLFPIALLKQAYLSYNKFRINTFDKILFPEYYLEQEDFVVQRDDFPFKLIKVNKNHLDIRLQNQFTQDESWVQDEYLLVFNKPCIIEPTQGWAITRFNHLIYPSLGFSRAPYVPKPPIKSLSKNNNAVSYPELISFRDTGEENYFHFYNDILPKLFFLEKKLDLPAQVPILISSKLYNKAYFQYFLKHPSLSSRTWILQEDQYIQSNKTYFCKPLTHTKKYYDRLLALVPDFTLQTEAERKIFITRSPKRLRFVENIKEIEAICSSYGFEVIDFDNLDLESQMKLFAQTRYAIGIHGAGLTNIIYRRGLPMSLLEIYPPGNYFAFHYVLLATQYGYAYDGLIGEKSDNKFSGGFYLNPEALKQKIELMLKG